jgi:hypothetical protein
VGVGSVTRGGRKTRERERERERAPGAVVSSADRGVGMAPGGAVRGGSARSRWKRAGEQGRAAGRRRRGVARLTGGPGGNEARWSVAGAGRQRGSVTTGRRQAGPGHTAPVHGSNSVLNRFKNILMIQIKFEFLQTLTSSKDTFPCSKKLK